MMPSIHEEVYGVENSFVFYFTNICIYLGMWWITYLTLVIWICVIERGRQMAQSLRTWIKVLPYWEDFTTRQIAVKFRRRLTEKHVVRTLLFCVVCFQTFHANHTQQVFFIEIFAWLVKCIMVTNFNFEIP